MKLPNGNKATLLIELLMLGLILAAPVKAQEATEPPPLAREERREALRSEHPEMAERMEERQAGMEAHRAEREAFLENNPEAAALVQERLEMRERHQAELEAWRSEQQDYLEAHPEAREYLSAPRPPRGPGFAPEQHQGRQGRR